MNSSTTNAGSIVAIITPFKDDFSVDYNAFEELLYWHIEQGTYGVVVAGSTGESATTSSAEKIQLIKSAVKVKNDAGKPFKVIANSGLPSTAKSISHSQQALAVGADELMIVTPSYVLPTQAGLLAHYRAIAKEVEGPIIVYNVPSRTGVSMSLETFAELAESEPKISGFKEAEDRSEQLASCINKIGRNTGPKPITVYCGQDELSPKFVVNCEKWQVRCGCISVAANVQPKLWAEYWGGEHSESVWEEISATVDILSELPNPSGVKQAMAILKNLPCNLRLPLIPITASEQEALAAHLHSAQ